VASSHRAAILPGLAGQGKSTLCAGLTHRGWRLLSDEVAPILPADGRVLPVPRPISLKNESIEIIRDFAPDAVIGPEWPGTSKGTVAHVLPPPESVERAHETAEPAWIVFPSFRKGEAASLLPVTKAKALMRTADNSFNYSVLGQRGFETLAALIDRCDCYDLVYGDLEAAVALFEGLRG
jgi:HprK-related kinase A